LPISFPAAGHTYLRNIVLKTLFPTNACLNKNNNNNNNNKKETYSIIETVDTKASHWQQANISNIEAERMLKS
jgi:hypothetical protein